MNEVIKNKILKLKELCDKGVGGERENALKLYNELILKYEIDEKEINNKLSLHNFIYHNFMERQLLIWIYYQVIGDFDYTTIEIDKNEKSITAYTTQIEADEILFLFNFYLYHLETEVKAFVDGFCKKQNFAPDITARKYEDGKRFLQNFKPHDKVNSDIHTNKVLKYAKILEKRTPIHEGIGG